LGIEKPGSHSRFERRGGSVSPEENGTAGFSESIIQTTMFHSTDREAVPARRWPRKMTGGACYPAHFLDLPTASDPEIPKTTRWKRFRSQLTGRVAEERPPKLFPVRWWLNPNRTCSRYTGCRASLTRGN